MTPKMEKVLKVTQRKGKTLYSEIRRHMDLIIDNPHLGDYLKGDLKDFRSYDFKFRNGNFRICYAYFEEDDHIKFVYVGTRENFYDEVKRYV